MMKNKFAYLLLLCEFICLMKNTSISDNLPESIEHSKTEIHDERQIEKNSYFSSEPALKKFEYQNICLTLKKIEEFELHKENLAEEVIAHKNLVYPEETCFCAFFTNTANFQECSICSDNLQNPTCFLCIKHSEHPKCPDNSDSSLIE